MMFQYEFFIHNLVILHLVFLFFFSVCKNLAFTSGIVVSFLSIPLLSAYLKIAAYVYPYIKTITYFLIVIVLSISGYLQSLKVIANPVDNLF